ncbi:MAG: hypothetical protein IKJ97_04500 [Bacteroidaceae bacterium]|nr:hypothetical protein [Bacteroidaceae bacterium]
MHRFHESITFCSVLSSTRLGITRQTLYNKIKRYGL